MKELCSGCMLSNSLLSDLPILHMDTHVFIPCISHAPDFSCDKRHVVVLPSLFGRLQEYATYILACSPIPVELTSALYLDFDIFLKWCAGIMALHLPDHTSFPPKQFVWKPIRQFYFDMSITISLLAPALHQYGHMRLLTPYIMSTAHTALTCDWRKYNVVYARFSARNPYVYIGSTSDYIQRSEQHTRETHYHHIKHAHNCGQQHTYDIMGRNGANEWHMVPVAFCAFRH